MEKCGWKIANDTVQMIKTILENLPGEINATIIKYIKKSLL